MISAECTIRLREPHREQDRFRKSKAKRKIICAGRRGGKTTGLAIVAVEEFLKGREVLYATPTSEQIRKFWSEIVNALAEPLNAKIFSKNETVHIIERRGTDQRIHAISAWNADTMRGGKGDLMIFDEWQLMNEDAWGVVGAPMLMDNGGDAVFIYTPPSLHSRSASKASDPRHASKMFKRAKDEMQLALIEGRESRWEAFHFRSMDNPYLSQQGIDEVAKDMSRLAYRQEILAEDIDEVPGALWTREIIQNSRVDEKSLTDMVRIVIAVDPPGGKGEDAAECGIVAVGIDERRIDPHGYVLADYSMRGSPEEWAKRVDWAYDREVAHLIVAEANMGNEMVRHTLHSINPRLPVKLVHASRGKRPRAEPVSALYELGRIHHAGDFPKLEDQMCSWLPGDDSPDRMDAMVWGFTELLVGHPRGIGRHQTR